jgi:peroxiredoxin
MGEFRERDILPVIVASDSSRELKKMSQEYDMVFIADIKKRAVIKTYKANWGGAPIHEEVFYHRKVLLPMTYLIDCRGVIVWKFAGEKKVRPAIPALLSAIDKHI